MKTLIPLLALITLLIGCSGGLLPTAPTQASPTLTSSSSVTFDANSPHQEFPPARGVLTVEPVGAKGLTMVGASWSRSVQRG